MTRTKIVIFTLCFVLVTIPAHAFVAAYVQRAIMILQQVSQLTQGTTQIRQFKEKLDKAREQIQMVKDLKDSARDGLNALKGEFTSLVSAPTDLVGDTMNWGTDFRGEARRTFDAARDFGRNGRSLREGWRGRLSDADQVNESDILRIYRDLPPEVAQRALEAWKRRRQQADSQLVHDHTVSDSAAALTKMLKETQASLDKLRNQKNSSATALGQATVTGIATQGELLTALAQLQAWQAARETAKSYEKEIQRRLSEAERLAQQRREKEASDALFRPNVIDARNEAWRQAWRPKVFSGRPDGPMAFGE